MNESIPELAYLLYKLPTSKTFMFPLRLKWFKPGLIKTRILIHKLHSGGYILYFHNQNYFTNNSVVFLER